MTMLVSIKKDKYMIKRKRQKGNTPEYVPVSGIVMFIPKRIIIQKEALEYDMTRDILSKFSNKQDIEIVTTASNKIKHYIPGNVLSEQYKEGKRTLIVGVKKSFKFQTCKPSAHYQMPLVSGCMGQCEYCYLNTMLGDKPFVKVYANVGDILNQAKKYINERAPEVTMFEGAATSDPVPVESFTHSLEKAITFFSGEEKGRFRFVTKYNDIDSLLKLEHKGHTEIRFSINTSSVIEKYEHFTASRDKRIEAGVKAAYAGYPTGYLIAPVFIYPGWQEEYHDLLVNLQSRLTNDLELPVTFEIISHRYTTTAKNRILQVFPESTLPMNDDERKYKYGQFGYGKYVYPKENVDEIKQFFEKEIGGLFKNKKVKYII